MRAFSSEFRHPGKIPKNPLKNQNDSRNRFAINGLNKLLLKVSRRYGKKKRCVYRKRN
ncbi:MAG: hypothetical protein ACLR2O_04550 [Coprococcus sp.]